MGSRYREKTKVNDPFTWTTHWSDGDVISTSTVPSYQFADQSFIWDVVGSPYPIMNPCTHLKYSVEGDAKPRGWTKWALVPGESPLHWHLGTDYSSSIFILPAVADGPSQSALNQFLNKAVVEVSTQVPEDVSIANFLWELKEEIVKILAGLRKYFSDCTGGLGRAYLCWHFAIKQFKNDLKKLQNIFNSAYDRLEFLKDSYGKPTTYKFREKVSEESFELPSVIPPPGDLGELDPATVSSFLLKRTITCHATFITYHEFEGLESAMALCDVLGAKLGLQNPIKVFWNAIPFSWLIDYFVDTSPFFDRLQLPSFSGEFKILASCHGWKVEETYACFTFDRAFVGPFPPYIEDTARRCGTVTATRYVRRPGIALGSLFTLKDELSDHQWRIILALIGTA